MHVNLEMLEKILDRKASSYAGVVAALPVLLAVILFGSFSFRTGRQTAPVIEKILTPPQVQQQEKLEFEESLPSRKFESVFEKFEEEKIERLSVPDPDAVSDLPDVQQVTPTDQPEVAMSEVPDQQESWSEEAPSVEVPGATADEDAAQIVPDANTLSDEAALRRATGPRQAAAEPAPLTGPAGGGAALGQDRSGDITPDPGITGAVVIRRQETTPGTGVGISQPASQEKLDLTGWILGNPAPLRPAVQEAMGYSQLKADRTSTGSVIDQDGRLYQLFFLHRIENNLLRILVVVGDQAYRIDLPDFYLEANHVKTGGVSRGQPSADQPNAPSPIIEVALESVSAIPTEVPGIFELVLDWLEIKGQE